MPEPLCPLVRRLDLLARLAPTRPALLGAEGETLATRQELAAAISSLSENLPPSLPLERPVVLSLANGKEFVTAFGALRARGVPVALVDASAPPPELTLAARAVGASSVLTSPSRLGEARAVWESGPLALGVFADIPPVALPRNTAVLKLTSGSTGVPKAIAVGARELATDAVNILHTMEVRPADITLTAIPLTHSYGISSCLVPLLLVGMPLAFPSSNLPPALAHTLERAAVVHFPAVPAHIRALVCLGNHLPPFPALRVCLTAGAPLLPSDGAAFEALTGVRVNIFYGSSECGAITYETGPPVGRPPGLVGKPVRGVHVEVVDEQLLPLPAGCEGRVLVRSGAVARGALPSNEASGLLGDYRFLAGDLGVFDIEGRLTLTGRVSELLNVAGRKVHPHEVQRALETVPGVRAAVVMGLPDANRGQLVAAVVAVDPAAGLTVPILLAACRGLLAPYKLPRRVVLVDELPVNDRGKVRREAILELLQKPPR